ncbi:MAG TPA: AtpZ/AtpI family protein [Bryobacteraceae bacterium]|jgi:hypothetical protein|nr:AtpZ/AtpI family protein [Bryobacteraceae bacterium]
MPSKPDRSLIVAGKYLSLAFTLPASAFAGFLLGKFAAHWLHYSFLPAAGIFLGIISGLVQIFRELAREMKSGK